MNGSSNSEYEAVIGLEVHVELCTNTKIFCSCKTKYGAAPNTQCCPVCMGMPGSMPSLNERAVEYAVRAGIATNCEIMRTSSFDRKNYFYPDLPKGYQITQYEHPICKNGYIDITLGNTKKRIGITRIHLEEDAGKLIHDKSDGTLIDCNRCGIPLIEIVSEPDISSGEEASAYLRALRSLMMYSGVSDCKMNEGSFRCDVNVSVRRIGDTTLGTRSEIKNLNSFSFTEKAIEYEKKRQIALLTEGRSVERETRRFDPQSEMTFPMRKKESETDYRFFPDPDLPQIVLTDRDIENIKTSMPALPSERRERYVSLYLIPEGDADILFSDVYLAEYFENAAEHSKSPRTTANILLSDVLSLAKDSPQAIKIPPLSLASLSNLFFDGTINSSTEKKLIKRMWDDGIDPIATVTSEGLAQIRDRATLTDIAKESILSDPKCVSDFKNGRLAAKKTIIGKAMKLSCGRADPVLLTSIIDELLSE